MFTYSTNNGSSSRRPNVGGNGDGSTSVLVRQTHIVSASHSGQVTDDHHATTPLLLPSQGSTDKENANLCPSPPRLSRRAKGKGKETASTVESGALGEITLKLHLTVLGSGSAGSPPTHAPSSLSITSARGILDPSISRNPTISSTSSFAARSLSTSSRTFSEPTPRSLKRPLVEINDVAPPHHSTNGHIIAIALDVVVHRFIHEAIRIANKPKTSDWVRTVEPRPLLSSGQQITYLSDGEHHVRNEVFRRSRGLRDVVYVGGEDAHQTRRVSYFTWTPCMHLCKWVHTLTPISRFRTLCLS